MASNQTSAQPQTHRPTDLLLPVRQYDIISGKFRYPHSLWGLLRMDIYLLPSGGPPKRDLA